MKTIGNYIHSLRPRQWIKNTFIFAPLLFSLNIFNIGYLKSTMTAFCLFSLIAGNIYVLNDIMDRKNDARHPKKKFRPIASGRLGVSTAFFLSVFFLVIAVFLGLFFHRDFFIISLFYILINILYSLFLKKIAVFDVMIIGVGFVLRIMIGGRITDIYVSPWLLLITFLLALFLGLVKRRQEVVLSLENHGGTTRDSLRNYSIPFLDQLISITTSATLISYMIYVLNPGIQSYFHTKELYLTVPFVIFGIFRYLYLAYIQNKGESPEEIIFSDLPFLINILLWIGVFAVLIYR